MICLERKMSEVITVPFTVTIEDNNRAKYFNQLTITKCIPNVFHLIASGYVNVTNFKELRMYLKY